MDSIEDRLARLERNDKRIVSILEKHDAWFSGIAASAVKTRASLSEIGIELPAISGALADHIRDAKRKGL